MAKKKKLTIAIDGNEANIENRVGVNQFAFEVIWGIYRINKNKKNRDNFRIFLQQKPLRDLPPKSSWWNYEVFGPKLFWTRTGLVKRLFLRSPKPDILYSPSHYGPGISPIPYVISVMDLGFLKFQKQFTKKDLYQLKNWTKQAVKKSTKIIAISEFTKKDIVKNYQVGKNKVVVSYPGFEKTSKKGQKQIKKRTLSQLGIDSDYILYLGTMKPSKNIENLVRAYHLLIKDKKLKNTKLVIAGKKGWLYQSIYNLVVKLKLEKQVVFTGFVTDNLAKALIKNAKVFALVSYWEGFGIPALEAMSLGTPVVSSTAGALPEITGKAALYANPKNFHQIASELKKALTNKKIREKLINKGKQRAKQFSWQSCSKIILETVKNSAK